MKKLILVLAILIAVPAFGVNIALTREGATNVIDVNYTGAGTEPNSRPRAFALKIEVDSPAKILDVNGFKIGESNSAGTLGYGIYPARIVIDGNGNVTSWGSPLADPIDPGAGTGEGTKQVVLEFGSLYVGGPNAPSAPNGRLCTFKVDCNGATKDVNIVATEENTYRGGIVFEDGSVPVPEVNATLLYTACAAPTKCLKSTIPDQNEWNAWVQWGEPNCWCFKRQCRGDANNAKLGAYWVASNDLNLLRRALNKNDACLATISYSGVPGICADSDHKKTGAYRVASSDLNILRKYLNQPEVNVPCCDYNAPGTAPDCNLRPPADPNEKYNFWLIK